MTNLSLTNNPLVNYARNSREELKKVTWPTRQQILRDTLIVIGISLALAAFFALADRLFDFIFQQAITR